MSSAFSSEGAWSRTEIVREEKQEPERKDRYSRSIPLAGDGSGSGNMMLFWTGVYWKGKPAIEGGINAAKLLRACGGCLGVRRRGRAWKTAKSPGELSNEHRSRDSRMDVG